MPKKRLEKKEKSGSPAWMTTFSDLMSLLLTFFILLYSFSTLDAIKFRNVASALQTVLLGQTDPTIFEEEMPEDSPISTPIPDQVETDIQEVYEQVRSYIEEQGLDAQVSVTKEKRGVLIDIKEKVLFDLGKAEIKPESKVILDKLGDLVNEVDKDIVIEGHTDNLPINTYQFPTNWELSTGRAVNVLRYFVEVNNADPRRISATGYGEYRPIAPNDNSEGRAINRRVNILLLVYGTE